LISERPMTSTPAMAVASVSAISESRSAALA
jgi:hypothetical protein